ESWRFPEIKTLLINQDNGGENNSRRTQFMKRCGGCNVNASLHNANAAVAMLMRPFTMPMRRLPC
ncbi:MAG: hypothetical protein V7K18_07405, partial [Nostoc sp.]